MALEMGSPGRHAALREDDQPLFGSARDPAGGYPAESVFEPVNIGPGARRPSRFGVGNFESSARDQRDDEPNRRDRGQLGVDHTQLGPDYAAIRGGPEFGALRRRLRRFIFPMSLLFMGWYMAFVLLAAYARSFMTIKVLGLINLGMVLGLAQFVSTVLIMFLYCGYAARKLDPALDEVRARFGVRS